MKLTYPYEEIIEFIASGPSPQMVIDFKPSERLKIRVEELITKEKVDGLSADETSELDHYMQLEHIMRLAKARARQNVSHA